ncbi:hypothetical protein B0H12DRAFT_1156266 [Mycena haematopus]|nr:hypothetical protein B0H12DRAFT_1156266 [Mycena haematopus]
MISVPLSLQTAHFDQAHSHVKAVKFSLLHGRGDSHGTAIAIEVLDRLALGRQHIDAQALKS